MRGDLTERASDSVTTATACFADGLRANDPGMARYAEALASRLCPLLASPQRSARVGADQTNGPASTRA